MDRDYQRTAVERVHEAFARGKRPLLVMPTGAGKTVTAVAAVAGVRPVVWCSHRTTLSIQARQEFANQGLRVCELREGLGWVNPHADVYVGTVQTLLHAYLPPAAVMVVDEAHHYPKHNTWNGVIERFSPDRVVGLTATPQRRDGSPLRDVFDELIVGATNNQLFDRGLLVKPDQYAPLEPVGKPNDLAMDPVDAVIQYSNGGALKTFLFTRWVKEAKRFASRLIAAGIPTAVVTNHTKPIERDAIIGRFRQGQFSVLASVETLTEGTDIPEASVAVLARNFEHASGLIQTAGRVMRPYPGKRIARVVDLAGAMLRHGPVTQDWDYSLDGEGISGTGTGVAPTPSSGRDTSQAVVPGTLVPLLGAPPVPPPAAMGDGMALRRINVWERMLAEALADGRTQRQALAQYRRQYHADPPGYRVPGA